MWNAYRKRRIAYIMSRFPKLTETFILYEILAIEKQGAAVEVFPLLKERTKTCHPEARQIVARAHFHPFMSPRILLAQWHFIRRSPGKYFTLWLDVLRSTFGSFNFFFGALGIFPKTVLFAYEMEKLQIQHIHAHFANHPALSAFIIHRLTGIPYSFTAHGSDLHVERKMLDKKLRSALFAVTVSSYNKNLMTEECGEGVRDRIHIIHCGVDTNLFQPRAERTNASEFKGVFQILCVASFEEVKGHRYLVEACRLLADREIEFTCHLVGDGPLRRKIETQIEYSKLADKIQLHGALPRNQIITMLGNADAFVLASVPTKQGKREGIPVVLMEAMSSGLPVVASNLSGIPELVEDGISGILTPPKDSQLLARALAELYGNPMLRSRMGKSGREKVLDEFSLEKNTSKLLKLFDRGDLGPSIKASSRVSFP